MLLIVKVCISVLQQRWRSLTLITVGLTQCYEKDGQYSFLLTNLCSILLLTTSSRGPRAVPSTEPAFFISLFRFFESLAVMLLPQQMLKSRLFSPTQTCRRYSPFWGRHWNTLAFSRSTVWYVLSWLRPQCCISSPVCCPGEPPGIYVLQPPPPLHLGWRQYLTYSWLILFKMKGLVSHHATKRLTSSLYSASHSSLMHPTTAESSEYFWRWQDSELFWKSEGYRVKRHRESTASCAAPMLQTTFSILQCHKLWFVGNNLGVFSTCIFWNFSNNSASWILLKVLEKDSHCLLCSDESGLIQAGRC